MKNVYSDLAPFNGSHVAGICTVLITPREWLQADPVPDFDTGKVLEAPLLNSGRFWIGLGLVENTYLFDETTKSSKSGDYKEISLKGDINFYHYLLQQQLETMRHSEWVVLLTDINNRRRLIGNMENGMALQYSHTQGNANMEERVQISLTMDSEDAPPFYNPDNAPEILYNLLQDIDGDFLLTH